MSRRLSNQALAADCSSSSSITREILRSGASFGQRDARRDRDIQGAECRAKRDSYGEIGTGMHLGRHAAPLAAEQEHIVGAKNRLVEPRPAARRQQHESPRRSGLEGGPVDMARHLCSARIVHPGPCQCPVGIGESHWFDKIDTNAKTRRKPQDCADIPGDIGLVKGNAHGSDIGLGTHPQQQA